MFRILYYGAAVLWAASLYADALTPKVGTPLPQAHAHNDYEHERPLLDAIENGFCGVEADVHLVDGELLVAHDADEVDAGRTLEKLYLQPLWEVVQHHRGRVYPGGPDVTLLIDFKTEGEPTWRALEPLLQKYRAMLTHWEPNNIQTNAVTVVISGNRPREALKATSLRLAAFDARLSDLPDNLEPAFAPLVSDNWRNHFKWLGEGPFPKAERNRLQEIVNEAHAQGKKIRFWAVPDREAAWQVLLEAGVDLINTDRLEELRRFLSSETGRN